MPGETVSARRRIAYGSGRAQNFLLAGRARSSRISRFSTSLPRGLNQLRIRSGFWRDHARQGGLGDSSCTKWSSRGTSHGVGNGAGQLGSARGSRSGGCHPRHHDDPRERYNVAEHRGRQLPPAAHLSEGRLRPEAGTGAPWRCSNNHRKPWCARGSSAVIADGPGGRCWARDGRGVERWLDFELVTAPPGALGPRSTMPAGPPRRRSMPPRSPVLATRTAPRRRLRASTTRTKRRGRTEGPFDWAHPRKLRPRNNDASRLAARRARGRGGHEGRGRCPAET